MEQYNFFKGINSKIDGQIQKLYAQQTKKQGKSIWDPTFFDPPNSQQHIKPSKSTFESPKEEKKIPTKKWQKSLLSKLNFLKKKTPREQFKDFRAQEINITHLKKNVLFQIMKEMMSEYLKRNHILSIENIVKNLNENEITTKTIKEKIILFGELLSIPVIYKRKNIKFQNQIRTTITPFYNLKQKVNLNKIYEQNNLISFTFPNNIVLFEPQYFLYCILESIKILFPETIPNKYKCLTFENIYQLLPSKSYSSVSNFLTETFPEIFFIIKEIGFSSEKSPKFFRYIFINQPVQKDKNLLDLLGNSRVKKIFIEKVSIKNPLFISFKLLSSAKNITHIFLNPNKEFCKK
jgi:hypothetical protein